jgi:hypothetical protein
MTMADPLTFALTQPELAARLVTLQRERIELPVPDGDAMYARFMDEVPIASRADAHEFAILTRIPVTWTQDEASTAAANDEPDEQGRRIRAPGFVRCWLEGSNGWRIVGASGAIGGHRGHPLEIRLDVAAPNSAHGFPVIVVIDPPTMLDQTVELDLARVAEASARYLSKHQLLQEEVPRTFLMALFLFLAEQLRELIGWFCTPTQRLKFGTPRPVRAFSQVGLDVLDYPVAMA